jgi:hypothetical protein
MKNAKLEMTIPGFHYSLFTIHGVGLSAFRPMPHAPCPIRYDLRFTIYDLRLFPAGGTP